MNDYKKKVTLLKSYIHILKNYDGNYELAKHYFIILHNFLIIEKMFFNNVAMSEKHLNKFLNLEKLNNVEDIYKKFLELYDVQHQIRNNIETFDNIENIKIYLSKKPEIYNKLMRSN